MREPHDPNPADWQAAAAALVASVGHQRPTRLQPLAGGGNNRVYRADVPSARTPLVLKHYYRDGAQDRDRLASEFAFCRFAWNCGAGRCPRALACHRPRRLGLYHFIPGKRVAASELTREDLHAAVRFLTALNAHRDSAEARRLPLAAEACFSIAEHVACVDARVARLAAHARGKGGEAEAARFVQLELQPAWRDVRDRLPADDGLLPPQARCLSPSDFGFHNALRTDGGDLMFLDFEYAGWDDPAKTICDFFCQVAVPVPLAWFESFAGGLVRGGHRTGKAGRTGFPGATVARAKRLLPLYQVKWACILLNELLPSGRSRRSFAAGELAGDSVHQQLAKARDMLARIQLGPAA